ncbi:MAG: hypothetical protein ACYS8Z_10390 [Planctomycetota bacterium]|jgi:hypothetical protein
MDFEFEMVEGVFLKAMAHGYNPEPFYYKEAGEYGTRFVAWAGKLSQLKELVYSILEGYPEELEVLLSVNEDNHEDNSEDWVRHYGDVSKYHLINFVQDNELYIFSGGDHQLCSRRYDTEEYIALDDHGVLFIYSDSEETGEICRANGFEKRHEKLILQASHCHFRPPDADTLRELLIQQLNLEEDEEED